MVAAIGFGEEVGQSRCLESISSAVCGERCTVSK